MQQYTQIAIDAAVGAGASYADIRIIEARQEDITVRNEALGGLNQSRSLGAGVRVIVDGAWGFASAPEITEANLRDLALRAVKVARASASLKQQDVRLAPEEPHQDRWTTPIMIDPFKVSLETKLALLFDVAKTLRAKPEIKNATAYLAFKRQRIWYANTDGTLLDQELIRSGGGFAATAVGHDDMQVRSYPNSFRGQFQAAGWELIESMAMRDNAERIREEAIALLTAPECPDTTTTLILHPTQLFLQIHESVGHATEMDRVLGLEANYAGTSFMTPEKAKGGFRYGSEIVNLIADGTLPGGLATRGYDDDGVRQGRFHIVKDGMFANWMTNREFTTEAGLERSNGCNRACDFASIPIVRINNLHLAPGDWAFDDLIADTPDGIYMHTNKSWSIDQQRLNFQFGCEAAWEVKDGKLGRLLKNPNYQDITPRFWGACDAICGREDWILVGTPNCGKGQPTQINEMSHGCSPARFQGVRVGVRAG